MRAVSGTEAATPTHSSFITDGPAGGVSDRSGVTLASRAGERREEQRHNESHTYVGYSEDGRFVDILLT
ncbi:hypothetical protein MINTM001_23430 [Mycobacterium paraintracellulare]|nr:hypothetical protein MINTM001_23430 [Mycobacterium paraintracellulare]